MKGADIATQKQAVGDDPAKLDELSLAGLEPISLDTRRAELMKEFRIEAVGEGQVYFTLGGVSRIEFLRKVQEVVPELFGRPVLLPDTLQEWEAESAFTATPANGGREIGVDGSVADSTDKTRAEQETKGWNNVDIADLAVAHAAYFLATGKDLFNCNVVRAREGALGFNSVGLYVYKFYCADAPAEGVAASAALPLRNKET